MKIKILYVLAGCLLLGSCSSQKTSLPYFADIAEISEGTLPSLDYEPVIKPDDELSITVNSLLPEATAQYQMPFTNPATTSTIKESSQTRVQPYLVNSQGDINFPVLGKLHVAGLTPEQLATKLTEEISKDVKDPIVNVRLLNFEVSVAGEVQTPSRIPLTRQRMSVLDALAAAGDLTEYGNRSNVLIVREEEGKRVYAHLDLNKAETLNSPYFYLKQNDYIYVSPNKIREDNSKYNTNNSFKLSVISTIVSGVSVVTSLIIALTVK